MRCQPARHQPPPANTIAVAGARWVRRALTFERQVVELHVRVALLNRFTQLGRPTTVPVVAMA
jgi:hypothetical protein